MRLTTLLFALVTFAGCGAVSSGAATTPPAPASNAPAPPAMTGMHKLTGATDDGDGAEKPAEKPAPKPACAPAYERACSDVCDGNYGMLCMFGTVCEPLKHYCEKPAP